MTEYKEVFVGREKELSEFFEAYDKKENPATIIIGESGIGKSSYLDQIVKRIREQSTEKLVFAGLTHVRNGTTNPASPFIGAIDDLMTNLEVPIKDRIEEGTNRFKKLCKKLFVEKGKDLAKSFLKMAAMKVLSKDVVEELVNTVEQFKETPTINSLAEETFSKQRGEFIDDLLYFVKELAETYKELGFILFIDQFERAPYISYDILLGLVEEKPQRLHVVVSLRMKKESLENYNRIKPDLVSLNVKSLTLPPLGEQEIAQWVLSSRDKRFVDAELEKIRALSGGIPFVISRWLIGSEKLNIEELRHTREDYCELIRWCFEGLPIACNLFLRKISILTQPLDVEEYEQLTGEKTGECSLMLEELERKWILSRQEDTFWFRHDLIKPCIEDKIPKAERIKYHLEAAGFYERKLQVAVEEQRSALPLKLNCAYHFHAAHNLEKSLSFNYECADSYQRIGALDLAESCYLRVITDASELKDERALYEAYITESTLDLAMIYSVWGRFKEARKMNLDIIARSTEKNDAANKSIALNNLALIEETQGNIDEAKRLHNESLKLKQELGDKQGIANTLSNLAVMEQKQGNIDEAKRLHNESLKLNQELKNKNGIAMTLGNLALIEQTQGNIDEAKRLHNESLKLKQELGDKQGIANTLSNLAVMEQTQGNIDEAKRLHNESLKLRQQLGDKQGIANTLGNLAVMEQDQGNIDEAKRLHNESLKLKQELGDKQGIANTLGNLGLIEEAQGNIDEAKRLYNESLKLNQELKDKKGIAVILRNLAALEQAQGNIDEAKRLYDGSLKVSQELGDRMEIAIVLRNMAALEYNQGRAEFSLEYLLEAAYLFNQTGSPYENDACMVISQIARTIKPERVTEILQNIFQQKPYLQEYLETK